MQNLKIKIVTGFRQDQYHTVDAEEAHKAYWLFMHEDKRTIFSSGIALVGKNIHSIEPDYHASMGWNPTHTLDSDDWNEIRGRGVDRALRDLLYDAKMIAQQGKPELMRLPLSEAKTKLLNAPLTTSQSVAPQIKTLIAVFIAESASTPTSRAHCVTR